MKKLLQIAALCLPLLFLPSPAKAAITAVGGCAAATTSCSPAGSFQAGDYQYIFAFRSATTAPTLPAGVTQIGTASANNSSFRSGCVVLTSSTANTSAWTNATSVSSVIYRGAQAKVTADCATVGMGIGGHTNSSGTTSTKTFGTLTMSVADGSSWVVGAIGDSVAGCTPAGMSSRYASTTVNILNDTNAGASAWSSTNCTGSTGNWKSDVTEILAHQCNSTDLGNSVTCVQSSSSVNGGSGTTNTVTLANVSASNFVDLYGGYCQAADCSAAVTFTAGTPTDTGTSTCVVRQGYPFTTTGAGWNNRTYLWRCYNLSAGSHTWTITTSGTTYYEIAAAVEISGALGTDDSAAVNNVANNSGTSSTVSTTATTANAVDLISAPLSPSLTFGIPGSGYKMVSYANNGFSWEMKTVSATGTQTATWTFASQSWQSSVAAIIVSVPAASCVNQLMTRGMGCN